MQQARSFMQSLTLFLLLLFTAVSITRAENLPASLPTPSDTAALAAWKAGTRVSSASVACFGQERCFCALPISDAVFERMRGKSYKANCTIARSELRYLQLLHYTLDGSIQIGEMVCHRDIAADLVSIFRSLFEARYPIERMVLIDDYGADDQASMTANNTSCFNYRPVAGTRCLSNHSTGRAVDINPLYNPCVRTRSDGKSVVSPAAARRYANRTANFRCKISRGDLCYRLFRAHGFTWGGSWRSVKDYQHFEKH